MYGVSARSGVGAPAAAWFAGNPRTTSNAPHPQLEREAETGLPFSFVKRLSPHALLPTYPSNSGAHALIFSSTAGTVNPNFSPSTCAGAEAP